MKRLEQLASRRNLRKADLNALIRVSNDEMLPQQGETTVIETAARQASSMSKEEKLELVSGWVKQNGFDAVANLVKKFIKTVLSFKEYRTAQMYEGFRTSPPEGAGTPLGIRDKGMSTKKKVLYGISDGLTFLTFILLLLAAGTSDFNSLVMKKPDVVHELQAVAAMFGTGALALLFRVFANKVK